MKIFNIGELILGHWHWTKKEDAAPYSPTHVAHHAHYILVGVIEVWLFFLYFFVINNINEYNNKYNNKYDNKYDNKYGKECNDEYLSLSLKVYKYEYNNGGTKEYRNKYEYEYDNAYSNEYG